MIGVGAAIWKITSAISNISVPLISALIVTVSATAFVAVAVYVPSPLSITALSVALPVVAVSYTHLTLPTTPYV